MRVWLETVKYDHKMKYLFHTGHKCISVEINPSCVMASSSSNSGLITGHLYILIQNIKGKM